MTNLSTETQNEIRQIKRLIKVNNKLMALDSQCTQSTKFLSNCSKINQLLNGDKYYISIGLNK